ncbi:MAG: dihydrolipoyl dehydrogenase [Candidatus Krumholzibacteria bacterium]|nr:dihydrolipoyl dehydrogenase [Candidatus Krumholzibacteria bacterium]
MTANTSSVRVVVIGAGPGGYAAAFLAADLGLEVALVDPEANPGGVCSYRGCIPSKALLHVARVISEAREATDWGVRFDQPQINTKKMQTWKDNIVKTLTSGLGQLTRHRKVKYIRGTAKFLDSHTLEIRAHGGEATTLSFEHAIIATGSRPAAVPTLDIESPRVLDSTRALQLDSVPDTLLVVGGGYIGLELGTVFATLGSRVSMVEMMQTLLPGVDKDLVAVLHRRVEKLFSSILLNTTVANIQEDKDGVRVRLTDKGSESREMLFDQVLVSVGRTPNSNDLGLENTRVQCDQRGFITVDATRRTDDPSIFAVGDVCGEPMLAHKASHEGRVAAEVIAGKNAVFEPRAIPAVVFTDPEIAWCGLTESRARAEHRDVAVAKFPWGASGRARTLGRNDGFTKWIVDPSTEQVLGLGIVGPGAGELIAEGVLAIEMSAVLSDVKLSIHPHPTLSETLMESAEIFYGQSTHVYRPKRQ